MFQNSKLKFLTEDKYTLSDIFIKNVEILLLMPLFLYILTPLIHICVYTFTARPAESLSEFMLIASAGHKPGDYYIAIIDVAMILAVPFTLVAVISYFISQKQSKIKRPVSEYIPLCFFAVFCLLIIASTIANGGLPIELMLGRTHWGEGLLTVFAYFLIFYLCASLVSKEKYKYAVIYSILAISMTVGILTLVNKYVYDIPTLENEEISGIFWDFNFYGYFLTISIMLSAALAISEPKKSRRVFAIIMFVMNSFILAVNNTLGCFVACLVAFIFMIIAQSLRKGKFSFSALILFTAFLLISFTVSLFYESFFTQLIGLFTDVNRIVSKSEDAASAGTARWGLWIETVKCIKEKPFIGHGFDGIAERLEEATTSEKVHNEYLMYAAFFGIPAAIIYIAGLISIYIKALIKRKKVDNATFCCLVAAFGYIGSAFFGNAIIYTVPFFYILLGLANTINDTAESHAKLSDDTSKDIVANTEIDNTITVETEKCENSNP